MTMTKERIQYFDILKGIAIFLVVMGHVLTMCIREIDNAFLFKLIERIHMPVFFFIAGYFSYKDNFVLPNIGKRALQLLVPFAVVSLLWILYFPHSGLQSPLNASVRGLLFSEYKLGYWFTPTLFSVIVLYSLCIPLYRSIRNDILKIIISVVIVILIRLILAWSSSKSGIKLSELFMIGPITSYFPVFVIGAIFSKNKSFFFKMLNNNKLLSFSIIIFSILLYMSSYSWEFNFPFVLFYSLEIIMRVSVVYVAIYTVKSWVEKVNSSKSMGNVFTRTWTYLGKESLAIYLLHYFFLFPLTFLQQPMRDMGLGFVPCLVVSLVVAAAVVAVTLGVNYIISQSKLLSLLLTGKNQYR